jgi:hypothetical protein
MAQGYDPAKAAVFNKLIQDGLSEEAALKQAGISGSALGNYELNADGQLGKIEIGFGQNPGVNNVTGTAAGKAIDNAFNSSAGPVNFNDTGPANFNDAGTVSASSVRSTSSTTTTTSGGGSTLRIADVGTTTPASAAYEAQANATYTDIKSISRELGPPQFGGNPNLTQEERNSLIAQRSSLYQQYNQDTTASTNALAPSAPAGSITTANTTTDVQTTEFATASTNAPVSGANDTQLQQQQIVSTSASPNGSDISRDTSVDPAVDPQAGPGENSAVPASDVRYSAEDLDAIAANAGVDAGEGGAISDQFLFDNETRAQAYASEFGLGSLAAIGQNSVTTGVRQANDQPKVSGLSQQVVNTDWRVTLRLAPDATYLYKDPDAGLLQPLKVTNGVVFPYTPTISTAYKANYSPYDLTHSNYRGYFYQNSYTDAVNLTATFTAQSTSDAAYVLAVIHFFRSVTKMFYGQDAQRGSPPPLVFLSGLGDYQFNNHPCVVTSFNYTLPADVDYISSGSPNNLGLNLQPLQNLYSTTLNAVSPTVTRLASAFLPRGAENSALAPLQSLLNNPTYVPSKIDLVISLLPVQSRSQVSKQFSLKKFANGNLLKGGFW